MLKVEPSPPSSHSPSDACSHEVPHVPKGGGEAGGAAGGRGGGRAGGGRPGGGLRGGGDEGGAAGGGGGAEGGRVQPTADGASALTHASPT